MRKVYARVEGSELRIEGVGTATRDRPCLVPEALAAELARTPELRVETDDDEPADAAPQPSIPEPPPAAESEE
jgi:hypothetical protein